MKLREIKTSKKLSFPMILTIKYTKDESSLQRIDSFEELEMYLKLKSIQNIEVNRIKTVRDILYVDAAKTI